MTHDIRPITERDIESFRDTLDVVAREQRFLAFLEAPPLEDVRHFVLDTIDRGYPQFVVVVDGRAAGWCDILPNTRRAVHAHCGTLGIGLLPELRGRGIGRELMRRTIDAALASGLTRIDLTVRETNLNAIGLYKTLGFAVEGLHRNAVRIGGRYEGLLSMALVTG